MASAVGVNLLPLIAESQEPPAIRAARELEALHQYGLAADTLGSYLKSSPEDGGTRWYMAQLLHRAGEMARAREAYEETRRRLPENPWVKLELAQLLLDMGEWTRARDLLDRILKEGPPGAAAEAARKMDHLRSLNRPWIAFQLGTLDDSQPYGRHRAFLEAGIFLNPLWSFSVRGEPRLLEGRETEMAGGARFRLQGYLPAARLQLGSEVGGSWQGHLIDSQDSPGESAPAREGSPGAWTGALDLSFDLGRGFSLKGAAGRSRYLWTLASADTLVMERSLELSFDRSNTPGWAGQALFRREYFEDDNSVTRTSGWILAPLVRKGDSGNGEGEADRAFRLRVGYAFSWADSRESRWVSLTPGLSPGSGNQGILPLIGDPTPGHYAPYHTPEEERVHSLLGETTVLLGILSLRLNGSYGFRAREDAPVLIVTDLAAGSPPEASNAISTRYFYPRSFSPWRLALEGSASLSPALTLTARAEAWETAYYEVREVSLGMIYRLGTGRGRVD